MCGSATTDGALTVSLKLPGCSSGLTCIHGRAWPKPSFPRQKATIEATGNETTPSCSDPVLHLPVRLNPAVAAVSTVFLVNLGAF